MSEDVVADLMVVLSTKVDAAVAGFTEVGTAGEEMATAVATATEKVATDTAALTESLGTVGIAAGESAAEVSKSETTIVGSVDRTSAAYEQVVISARTAATENALAMDKMAADTAALSAKMQLAATKAEESNVAIGTAYAKAEEASAKSTAGQVKNLGLATLAIGAVGVGAVDMAAKYETSTNKLVTSAGESKDALEQVRQGMLQLAGEVGVSATSLSDAMYKVESAGYHGAAGLGLLKAAEQGAKAEGADGAKVADALSSAMRDYYPHAQSAADVTKYSADVMSKLIGATSAGKMTFDDLAGSLNSILPVSSAANISLNDTLGVLASMTVHGISADQATQNMADAIRHLQTAATSTTQSKALASIGLDANDVSQKLGERGLSGTLELISSRIKNFMPPGSSQVILDLGTALNGTSQRVQDLADKLLNGTVTAKQYTQAAKGLTPIEAQQAQKFAALAGSYHQLGTEQLSGQAVMATYSGLLQQATGDATGLKVALMTTGENAGYTNDAIQTISGSTADAAGNVKGWQEVQDSFNQKLSETKASLGALAINMGNALLPILKPVIDAFATFAGWLARNPTLATALVVALGALAIGLTGAAIAAWDFDASLLANPITWIVAAIALLIVGIVELITHLQDVGNFFAWLWGVISDGVSTAWNAVIGFFEGIPGVIGGALAGLGSFLAGLAKKAWDAFTNALKIAWQATLTFLKNLPHEIGFALGFLIGLLAKLAIDAWNAFTNGIKTAWNATVAFFTNLPGWIAAFFTNAPKWLYQAGVWILTGLWNGLQSVWHFITDFATGTYNAIINFFKSAPGWLVTAGRNILTGLWNGIRGVWHFVTDAPHDIWQAITSAFSGAINWLWQAGRDLVMGIWNGIQSLAGWLWSQAKAFAQGILDGIKAALGISSPSKHTHAMGQYLVQGLANGITANAHVAAGAMAAMVAQVLGVGKGLNTTAALTVTPGAGGALGGGYGMQSGAVAIDPRLSAQFVSSGSVRAGTSAPGSQVTQVIVNVAGSAVTERQLIDVVQAGMLKAGGIRPTTYQPYRR